MKIKLIISILYADILLNNTLNSILPKFGGNMGAFRAAVRKHLDRIPFYRYGVPIGKDTRIYGWVHLRLEKDSEFRCGKDLTIRSSWKSNPAGGGRTSTQIRLESGAKLIIGDKVGISNTSICCSTSITIEDNVLIGVNCSITDTDHHSVRYEDRINGNKNYKSAPIVIKEGAWIGGHSLILKGVTIGCRSVIGAGSVVTKSVPDNELWAGNPAKFIRKINQ